MSYFHKDPIILIRFFIIIDITFINFLGYTNFTTLLITKLNLHNNNKMDKIIFLKEEIFKYLSYKELLNIKLLNKYFYSSIKYYFISGRYLKNLSREIKHEEEIKNIIGNCLSIFPFDNFILHKYDHEIVEEEEKYKLIVEFTYKNNYKYHIIKLINLGIVNIIEHQTLDERGFSPYYETEVLSRYVDEYDYDEDGKLLFRDEKIKEIINNKDYNFRILSKKMGFDGYSLEIYKFFMNICSYYLELSRNNIKSERFHLDFNEIFNINEEYDILDDINNLNITFEDLDLNNQNMDEYNINISINGLYD